jgi:hypothetical protein
MTAAGRRAHQMMNPKTWNLWLAAIDMGILLLLVCSMPKGKLTMLSGRNPLNSFSRFYR